MSRAWTRERVINIIRYTAAERYVPGIERSPWYDTMIRGLCTLLGERDEMDVAYCNVVQADGLFPAFLSEGRREEKHINTCIRCVSMNRVLCITSGEGELEYEFDLGLSLAMQTR